MNPSHNGTNLKKFYKWTITDIVRQSDGIRYICMCECGRVRNISKTSITRKVNKLCDCMQDDVMLQMMDKSIYELSKHYNTTDYEMFHYIRNRQKVYKRYKSKERRSYISTTKVRVVSNKNKSQKPVEKIERYKSILPPNFQMNHKGLGILAGAVIRQAVKDEDAYFFESDNFENFAVCSGLNVEKEKYLQEIQKRKAERWEKIETEQD